jgi:hypothetical protein
MNIFQEIVAFFEGHAANNPAIAQAQTDVENAASSVEKAVPALADDLANEVLGKIPFGSLAEPVADGLINAIIAKFEAKLSPAAQAAKAT